MEKIVESIVVILKTVILNYNPFVGMLIGLIIVMMESMIPIMPLAVFIAFNILIFGNIVGFIISIIGTIMGCIISFTIFRKGFSTYLYKKIESKKTVKSIIKKIDDISLPNLVILMAMPFTPAFIINIGSGLSKIDFKKYFVALLIGKPIMVYFWGFVGTTFLQSITDVKVIINLALVLLLAYILSYFANKKLNIK